VTPHGLDLPVLTAAYGLGASVVDRIDALAGRLSKLLGSGGPHAVIVPVDRETDLKQRRALDDAARLVISDLS
jgi:thiamine pyrophosphate-dependent acetolactate synthase large subunit-like protein